MTQVAVRPDAYDSPGSAAAGPVKEHVRGLAFPPAFSALKRPNIRGRGRHVSSNFLPSNLVGACFYVSKIDLTGGEIIEAESILFLIRFAPT